MNLCRSNQQPSGIYMKYNELQPRIEPFANDLNLRAVGLLPDHIADNGCSAFTHEGLLPDHIAQWSPHGGGVHPQSPHRRFKKIKTSLFKTIRLFSYRVCRNCCHVFLCYPTCSVISRKFHCDAIIPVVKLFWWLRLNQRLTQNASQDKVNGYC